MRNDLDCYNEKNIRCPYCYEHCEDDSCKVINTSEGDYVNFQCESCGKEFKVLANVEITYTSVRIDEEGEIIDTWLDLDEGDCKYGCYDCIWQGCETCDNCIDANHYDDECK